MATLPLLELTLSPRLGAVLLHRGVVLRTECRPQPFPSGAGANEGDGRDHGDHQHDDDHQGSDLTTGHLTPPSRDRLARPADPPSPWRGDETAHRFAMAAATSSNEPGTYCASAAATQPDPAVPPAVQLDSREGSGRQRSVVRVAQHLV